MPVFCVKNTAAVRAGYMDVDANIRSADVSVNQVTASGSVELSVFSDTDIDTAIEVCQS